MRHRLRDRSVIAATTSCCRLLCPSGSCSSSLTASVQLTAAAPSVHVAATPSVFIQPSCGHNPIYTRLQPYPASSSARCPASPDGPPYSLDEHGSCRTSSESSTSPALRLLSSRRRWFLRRVFCRRRSARSERVHDALIGNQRCLRPARLGGRWGHHVGVGSRAARRGVRRRSRRGPPPARAA